MSTLLDCFNLMIDLCNKLTNQSSSNQLSNKDQTDDKTVEYAIDAAKEIISTYDAVQHQITEHLKEAARINQERRDLGDRDTLPYKPRSSYYRYWNSFDPIVAIKVLHILINSVNSGNRNLWKLIDRLSDIVKPFRCHKPIDTTIRSLGVKRYKFNPYAQWVQTFSDHQLPYKKWVASGLYDNTELTQDLDRFFAALQA